MKKYDIYIAVPIWNETDITDNNELSIFKKRGWAGLELDFNRAKEILVEIKRYRSGGYIVLNDYKFPQVTLEDARKIAIKEHQHLINNGRRLNRLEDGYDNITCWTFNAEDNDAIEKGSIPGRISISIDKIDGHLRSNEEFKEWIKQSFI